MVLAKNYEPVSTSVEAMKKKLWPLFSGHGVYQSQYFITIIINKIIPFNVLN